MKQLYIILATIVFWTGLIQKATAQEKIHAMIATGQDGSHWWKGANQAIKEILENSGLFTVDILATPSWGEDISLYNPDFSNYELVVVNYGGSTWPEKTRKNFEKYVSEGGGVVILNSSVVPMEDWEAYNTMTGLGAWNGRDEKDGPYVYWKNDRFVYDFSPGNAGHHALQHSFTVTHRQPEHPIMRGLEPVWDHFKDELYGKLRGPAKNIEVLATAFDAPERDGSGRDEPLLWTVNYGKGKVFVTLMGHVGNDPNLRYSMDCTGFQVTLLRGAEWAATGQVKQAVPKDFPSKGIITLRKDYKAPPNAH